MRRKIFIFLKNKRFSSVYASRDYVKMWYPPSLKIVLMSFSDEDLSWYHFEEVFLKTLHLLKVLAFPAEVRYFLVHRFNLRNITW